MGKRKSEKRIYTAEYSDVLTIYFRQIKRMGLLTFEEEKGLSKKVLAGDEKAKATLIKHNLRLVVKIASRYFPEISLLDKIQKGNLGLIKAAGKYDYRKNTRFGTYAAWWIKQTIERESLKEKDIPIPYRKNQTLKELNRENARFWIVNGRFMNPEEIYKITGINEKGLRDLSWIQSQKVISLDKTIVVDAGISERNSGGEGLNQEMRRDMRYCPEKEIIEQE